MFGSFLLGLQIFQQRNAGIQTVQLQIRHCQHHLIIMAAVAFRPAALYSGSHGGMVSAFAVQSGAVVQEPHIAGVNVESAPQDDLRAAVGAQF
jgi:hypothetical protein